MDSLQLLTLYLILRSTHIFSVGKAKINLQTTPKLTVVMPINCLLRSIQLPSPQNDAITSYTCACFPATSLYVFSRAPQYDRFLLPGLSNISLQFVLAFFNHSIKIAQFFLLGGISFPFQAILTDDAFCHQCKRMASYPMTKLSYTF